MTEVNASPPTGWEGSFFILVDSRPRSAILAFASRRTNAQARSGEWVPFGPESDNLVSCEYAGKIRHSAATILSEVEIRGSLKPDPWITRGLNRLNIESLRRDVTPDLRGPLREEFSKFPPWI